MKAYYIISHLTENTSTVQNALVQRLSTTWGGGGGGRKGGSVYVCVCVCVCVCGGCRGEVPAMAVAGIANAFFLGLTFFKEDSLYRKADRKSY